MQSAYSFVSVAMTNHIYQSPLNYTGGKYRLLPQILPYFPKGINTFIDLFCGGCNVGLNVIATNHTYNDINPWLIGLYSAFKNNDKGLMLNTVYEIINKHNLSLVSKYGYAYYNCDSSSGLGPYNRDHFRNLKIHFNQYTGIKDYYYYAMLYVLIVYSFNNQIRFNKDGEFNLPIGKRDFNSKMESKLLAFIDIIKSQNASFTCLDFTGIDSSLLSTSDFVYIDPPYLITCATYNEQNAWNEEKEHLLLKYIDNLTARHIRCALSNVLSSKGKINIILNNWLKCNVSKYNVHHLRKSYANSSYHTSEIEGISDEVLITNY